MKRMLINAIHKEELRIAFADGQHLYDLSIESTTHEHKKSNIYKGIVTRIEPSLDAAFVDFGEERHGFLSLKEVSHSCFKSSYEDAGRRPLINEVLEEGQELIIQVVTDERGNKGAALTTFLTLLGSYLILMPNNPRAGGVSRRIEGDTREKLQDIFSQLQLPEGMGLIIRTAGSGRSLEELQGDLDILLRLYDSIQNAAKEASAPFLIYREHDPVIRALRDYLRNIDEILVDNADVFDQVTQYLKRVRADFIHRLKYYNDPTPLFTRFQIESQIESAFQREVRLPSGGSITIDHTEALVAIDINSAKSTKGGDIEETAVKTNLEAVDEISRQLRLRDLAGLVVIDFIDMNHFRNQRAVEERLADALADDRARVQIGRLSRFGLLEMSRQRLRPQPLDASSRITCPRCQGRGTIRGVESLGLSIIRIIEEEALKENTAQVRTIVPNEVAAYLLNEKRQAIIDIEKRQNVTIVIVPSSHFLIPQYEIERVRSFDLTEKDEKLASYKLAIKPEVATQSASPIALPKQQEPVIKSINIEHPGTPLVGATSVSDEVSKEEPGILKKIFTFLFDKDKKEQPEHSETAKEPFTKKHTGRYTGPKRKHHAHSYRGKDRDRGRFYKHSDHRSRPRPKRENTSELRGSKPRQDNITSQQHVGETHLVEQIEHQAVTQAPFTPPKPQETKENTSLIIQQEQVPTPKEEKKNVTGITNTSPAQENRNKSEQKPRRRFKPRYRHRSSERQESPTLPSSLEGEDIYTNHKKDGTDSND